MDMSRQSRRRALVLTVYALLLVMWVLTLSTHGSNEIQLLLAATIVNGFVLGGYGKHGLIKPFVTRPFRAGPVNDERDRERRDRMHFNVYRFMIALFILGYFLGLRPFQLPQVSRAMLLLGIILGPTLPQALLLWSEPDVDVEEIG
jgi:hypothetical protein